MAKTESMQKLHSFFATTFGLRCPECCSGGLYARVFHIRPHATCPSCSVRFERDQGVWLIPTFLTYGSAVLVALLFGFILGRRYGLFPGFEWVLIAITFSYVILGYKFIKAFSIWILWMMGEVRLDGNKDTSVDSGLDAVVQS